MWTRVRSYGTALLVGLCGLAQAGCYSFCDGSELFARAEQGELRAIHELGELGDPRVPVSKVPVKPMREAYPVLAEHLDDPDPFVRLHALEAIRRLGQRSRSLYRDRFDGLVDALLRDPDPQIRWRTAWTLGRLQRTNASLRAATADDVPRVVERAVWALGQARDQRALPLFVACLEFEPEVAEQAVRSLRRTTGVLLQGADAWRAWAERSGVTPAPLREEPESPAEEGAEPARPGEGDGGT